MKINTGFARIVTTVKRAWLAVPKCLFHPEVGVADSDQVPPVQDLTVKDVGMVQLRAVLAAQVLNPELPVLKGDESVMA